MRLSLSTNMRHILNNISILFLHSCITKRIYSGTYLKGDRSDPIHFSVLGKLLFYRGVFAAMKCPILIRRFSVMGRFPFYRGTVLEVSLYKKKT